MREDKSQKYHAKVTPNIHVPVLKTVQIHCETKGADRTDYSFAEFVLAITKSTLNTE